MRYPFCLRSIHLALAALCLAGWGSAQFAGDYKQAVHVGFSIHQWVGIGFVLALGLRMLVGLVGPAPARFSTWLPFTKPNLRLIADDVENLVHFRFPEERRMRESRA